LVDAAAVGAWEFQRARCLLVWDQLITIADALRGCASREKFAGVYVEAFSLAICCVVTLAAPQKAGGSFADPHALIGALPTCNTAIVDIVL